MPKRKKSKQAEGQEADSAMAQSETLNANLPQEIHHIMHLIDDHLRHAEQNMQNSLKQTYQLINQARGKISQPDSSYGSGMGDQSAASHSQIDPLDPSAEAAQAELQSGMIAEMEKAQEVMRQSIEQGNLQAQQSIDKTVVAMHEAIAEQEKALQQMVEAEEQIADETPASG